MQTQRGRYYLSRVIKLGALTQDKLVTAILGAPVLRIGKFQWAITDAEDGRPGKPNFVFGKLAKYSAEGHVTIVDPAKKSQLDTLAPNLLMASSPFVYLPDYSGIAFLHVWNGIQEDLFPKRFCSLIEAAYQNFFVDCSVEPVADYRAFVEKLDSLDRITEMSATPAAYQSAMLTTSVIGAVMVSATLYYANIKVEELFRQHRTQK